MSSFIIVLTYIYLLISVYQAYIETSTSTISGVRTVLRQPLQINRCDFSDITQAFINSSFCVGNSTRVLPLQVLPCSAFISIIAIFIRDYSLPNVNLVFYIYQGTSISSSTFTTVIIEAHLGSRCVPQLLSSLSNSNTSVYSAAACFGSDSALLNVWTTAKLNVMVPARRSLEAASFPVPFYFSFAQPGWQINAAALVTPTSTIDYKVCAVRSGDSQPPIT